MQPEPFKHRPHPTKSTAKAGPETNPNTKDDSIADSLMDTNVGVLVILGKGIKRFGVKPVVGFVVGAVCTYGYAVYTPLPYVQGKSEMSIQGPVATPAQVKTVQLHGLVRDHNNLPVKGLFAVGILANQLGPTTNSDGSFVLEVPQSNSYNVAYWTTEDEKVRVSYGNTAEKDGNGYRLQNVLTVVPTEQYTSATATSRAPTSRTQVARLEAGGR
jgi:hypothetical protein